MRIRLLNSDTMLSVPYQRNGRSGAQEQDYFDLKLYPTDVSEIPELFGLPEFKSLIHTINERESIFRTVGCGRLIATNSDPVLTKKFETYFDLVFEVFSLNTEKSNHILFFNRLESFSHDFNLPDSVSILSEICPTYFSLHDCHGWRTVIGVAGLGRQEKEARAAWHLGLELLKSFFASESVANARLLKQGFRTIS